MSTPINITYLGGPDIKKLNLSDAEILEAIENSLVAQGKGETVIEPRAHLIPNPEFNGHFNVLRGYISSIGGDGGLAANLYRLVVNRPGCIARVIILVGLGTQAY